VAEAKARAELLKRRIHQPEWNVEVEDENGVFIAMPDGYWEDLAAALEIDSMRFHLSPQDYQRTQQRQRRMTSYGILVIPVAPTDIIDDPAAFGHMVERTLAAAALRPTPPVRVRRNRAA
jgi:hypothetical protein